MGSLDDDRRNRGDRGAHGAILSTVLILNLRRQRVRLRFVLERDYPASTKEEQAHGMIGLAHRTGCDAQGSAQTPG